MLLVDVQNAPPLISEEMTLFMGSQGFKAKANTRYSQWIGKNTLPPDVVAGLIESEWRKKLLHPVRVVVRTIDEV